MKRWATCIVVSILFIFTGCSQKESQENRPAFSVLIAKPVDGQVAHFIDGKQAITSVSNTSAVSAMIINNPILAGKDAIVAIAIENRGESTIDLKWDDISFFNPKNRVTLLPVSKIKEYFSKPNRCKPMLNTSAFKDQMIEYGVISPPSANLTDSDLLATEKALHEIFREIKEDLCYTRLPNDTTLKPHEVTVGYMVIQLPKEHFGKKLMFMLKIPVAGKEHKLRYALQPLE